MNFMLTLLNLSLIVRMGFKLVRPLSSENFFLQTDHADGVDCPDMVIGDSPFEVSDEMIKRLRSFMSIGQHHS